MSTGDSRIYTHINFSKNKGSLPNVGYTIYDARVTSTVITARTTTGVSEVGVDTGIYSAVFQIPNPLEEVIVLWDTGEGGGTEYALDHGASRLFRIENNTARVNNIHNAIKNMADFQAKMMRELARENDVVFTADVKNQIGSVFTKILKENREEAQKIRTIADGSINDRSSKEVQTLDIAPIETGITSINDQLKGSMSSVKRMTSDFEKSRKADRVELKEIRNEVMSITDKLKTTHKTNNDALLVRLSQLEAKLGDEKFKDTVIRDVNTIAHRVNDTTTETALLSSIHKLEEQQKQIGQMIGILKEADIVSVSSRLDAVISEVKDNNVNIMNISKRVTDTVKKVLGMVIQKLDFLAKFNTILTRSSLGTKSTSQREKVMDRMATVQLLDNINQFTL